MRECGSCSECCRLLAIDASHAPEIGPKPAGQWCKHCTQPGCSVYSSRPQLCADFKCQWLVDERLGEEWKPSRCGMILVWQEQPATLFIVTDPAKPDAPQTMPFAFDIGRMTSWGKRSPEPFEVRIAEPPTPECASRAGLKHERLS
jgi:hypothetical protein